MTENLSRRAIRNSQVQAFFATPKVLTAGTIVTREGQSVEIPATGVVSLPEGQTFRGAFGEVGRNGFLVSGEVNGTVGFWIVGQTNLKLGRVMAGDNAPALPGKAGTVSAMEFRRADAAAQIAALPSLSELAKEVTPEDVTPDADEVDVNAEMAELEGMSDEELASL